MQSFAQAFLLQSSSLMIRDKEEKKRKHKTESALIVQNRWATIGTQKRKSSGTPSTLSLVIPHFRSDLFIIMIFYDIIQGGFLN